MQNKNTIILNLKSWAGFAVSPAEEVSIAYNEKRITGQEAKEMLAFLAGYLGASAEGKKVLAEILKL